MNALFLVSHATQELLAMDRGRQLRIISAGAKIFAHARGALKAFGDTTGAFPYNP